jgi:hypothetical protein
MLVMFGADGRGKVHSNFVCYLVLIRLTWSQERCNKQ